MPRVKRGRVRASGRKNLLKRTKGYMWGRKNKVKLAKPAVKKAGVYAYRDRRNKKRARRRLFQIKINAASRQNGITYSRLLDKLNKAGVKLDRKVLSQLAEQHPIIFAEIASQVK